MSASTHACWKGMTRDDYHDQPHFGDGGCSWGNWVAGMFGRPDLLRLARKLRVAELLSHKTDGMFWFQIKWLAPQEFSDAVDRMQQLIEGQNKGAREFLEVYSEHAL